jgi:hypothetical protein
MNFFKKKILKHKNKQYLVISAYINTGHTESLDHCPAGQVNFS